MSDFTVRREKVLTALQWLKLNNPFHNSIVIDYAMIEELPENGVPNELLHMPNCSENATQSALLSNNVENDTDYESDTEMDCTECAVHEPDNEVAEHNYTSFIPVSHQEPTEIEAI